jgi:penicillin-binding protein 1A
MHVIERVRNRAGTVLFARAPQNLGRIVEPHYVAMMNAMMRETLISGTARGAQLPGWPAAGKTGTSQDFRDAWFIGYTGHLVTGVWLGNDDSSPMRKLTGGSLPVEIWSRVMKAGHVGVPVVGLPAAAAPSFASAVPPTTMAPPSAPVSDSTVRPQRIDPGIDGWFLERLFGRR